MSDRPEHESLIRVEDILAALPALAQTLSDMSVRLDLIEDALDRIEDALEATADKGRAIPRTRGVH